MIIHSSCPTRTETVLSTDGQTRPGVKNTDKSATLQSRRVEFNAEWLQTTTLHLSSVIVSGIRGLLETSPLYLPT